MLISFYRDHHQRKNDAEIDSPMRIPRPIQNKAISVKIPRMKHWDVAASREFLAAQTAGDSLSG